MFKTRSTKNKLMDNIAFNSKMLRRNLDELVFFNRIFGSKARFWPFRWEIIIWSFPL